MKITGLKTYKFSVPTGQEVRDPHTGELLCSTAKPWLFLKVETDGGITGWGEGSGEWLVPSVETTLQEWYVLLEGRNPLEVTAITDDIQNRLPWKGGPVFGTAIAAVNLALYDIAGKAWGVPLHTVLGGKRRHALRVYMSGTLFDPKVAKIFIKHVGVFPVGSMVELTTGQLGLVAVQNESDPLKPTVIIFKMHKKLGASDKTGNNISDTVISRGSWELADLAGERVGYGKIKCGLDYRKFNINPEYYLSFV